MIPGKETEFRPSEFRCLLFLSPSNNLSSCSPIARRKRETLSGKEKSSWKNGRGRSISHLGVGNSRQLATNVASKRWEGKKMHLGVKLGWLLGTQSCPFPSC